MHDHDSGRLVSFADVLAGELPDAWTSCHHPAEDKDDLADLTDRIWDMDLVAQALVKNPLQQAAVLTRQDGAQLVVLDRPGRDGFLIAAVAPRNLPSEAFRGLREPDGIVLTDDPFHSAELVAGDLLARFDTALAQVRCNAAGTQPSQPDRVVLTWQPDGSLAAAPVSEKAAEVLAANGFVRDESGTYRLSGDDTTAQARAVRAIGPQLDAHGIAVALQHPSGRIPPTATPPTPSPVPAATRASAGRRR
ncbi:hypothetical protein [Streptomyces cathayae]|uniref:ESAT-6 protein secretion system EspG family protein n=1 Tax=Streptomyces cathayae TaxID=3031124 RepID=A0ABY8K0K2_9ACTN|nr:hypothetical protein [Streptomyces sp. HUAS 5]WGD39802.1 hypothetical protein PYS65_06470 [Streptomyces sp. HUAS 5]